MSIYANVLSSQDYRAELKFDYYIPSEPLMLLDGLCLDILKQHALIRTDAQIPADLSEMNEYRNRWIENARRQAERAKDSNLLEAVLSFE